MIETYTRTLDVRPATPAELGGVRVARYLLDIGAGTGSPAPWAALVLRREGAHRGSWGWDSTAVLLLVDRETGERLMAARDDVAVQAVLASGRVLHSATIPA
jgi:hypothetical protein